MARDSYRKYFDVLDLTEDATETEVREAYRALKRLYTEDSIITSPLKAEFPDSRREEIVGRIDDAYERLRKMFIDRERDPERNEGGVSRALKREHPRSRLEDAEGFGGETLRRRREQMNIDLMDIAYATKISKRYIENLEKERFDELPQEVYVRGFVANYARHLSLDPKRVTEDYMKRYGAWKQMRGKETGR